MAQTAKRKKKTQKDKKDLDDLKNTGMYSSLTSTTTLKIHLDKHEKEDNGKQIQLKN